MNKYKILIIAIFTKIIQISYLFYYCIPNPTSDATFYKQAAINLLKNNKFNFSSGIGEIPHASEIFAVYPPIYPLLNYLNFSFFEVSLFSSNGLDLLIHTILVILVTYLIWDFSFFSIGGLIFFIFSTLFIFPIGRPDELGAMFFIAAFLSIKKAKIKSLGYIFLALSIATSPFQGLLGLLLVSIFFLHKMNVKDAFKVIFYYFLICIPLAILFSGPAFDFRYFDAAEQFFSHLGFRSKPSILDFFSKFLIQTVFVITIIFINNYYLMLRPKNSRIINLDLKCLIIFINLSFVLLIILKHHYYALRPSIYISLAILLYQLDLKLTNYFKIKTKSIIKVAIILIFLIPFTLVRGRIYFTPLFWNDKNLNYSAALKIIEEKIPKDSFILTSPEFYFMNNYIKNENIRYYKNIDYVMPDYIVSLRKWGSGGKAAMPNHIREIVSNQYELLYSPKNFPTQKNFFQKTIKISDNRIDFSPFIWRRSLIENVE